MSAIWLRTKEVDEPLRNTCSGQRVSIGRFAACPDQICWSEADEIAAIVSDIVTAVIVRPWWRSSAALVVVRRSGHQRRFRDVVSVWAENIRDRKPNRMTTSTAAFSLLPSPSMRPLIHDPARHLTRDLLVFLVALFVKTNCRFCHVSGNTEKSFDSYTTSVR
jgi:hypothetical protein